MNGPAGIDVELWLYMFAWALPIIPLGILFGAGAAQVYAVVAIMMFGLVHVFALPRLLEK